PFIKGSYDAGRHPPDITILIRHGVEETPLLLPDAALPPVIARVHEKGERHLEHRVDLVGIDGQRKAGTHNAENRRDPVATACHVVRHTADDLDALRLEPDLLPRLAQGGSLGRGVLGVDAPAGKGDLARVASETIRAPGEYDGGALVVVHHRYQHGGIPQT